MLQSQPDLRLCVSSLRWRVWSGRGHLFQKSSEAQAPKSVQREKRIKQKKMSIPINKACQRSTLEFTERKTTFKKKKKKERKDAFMLMFCGRAHTVRKRSGTDQRPLSFCTARRLHFWAHGSFTTKTEHHFPERVPPATPTATHIVRHLESDLGDSTVYFKTKPLNNAHTLLTDRQSSKVA